MSKLPSLRTVTRALRWPDLVVLPLALALSILPLLWFERSWWVGTDGWRYLLLGWNLISGEGYTLFGDPYTERGPVFPGLLGGLMLLFGRDVESLVWTVRLLTLANPVLMYFLVKRIAGPAVGLLAAAIITVLGLTATYGEVITVDAFQLTLYLGLALAVLIAAQKDSAVLWLLAGLLLGAAILTKPTSLVTLPIALFAALHFGRSFRGLLLHYSCVAAVCLPWWVWVYAVSGRIHLMGRFPSELVIPVIVAALALAAVFVAGYRYGIVARLVAKERWRRRIAWFVVLAPTATLSVLVLYSGFLLARALETRVVLEYITSKLAPHIPLWYLLPFAGAYVLFEAVRGNRLWGFYSALLVLQVPVSLVALQGQLNVRQWLVVQTLLYGALAGLLVKAVIVSAREGRQNLRRPLAFGAVAVLTVVLVQAAVVQVRSFFDDEARSDAYDNISEAPDRYYYEANSSVSGTHRWIAANIPEGEEIITTRQYATQLAFLDGMQHGWTILQIDGCGASQIGECRPGSDYNVQAPPQPAVWFQMDRHCNGQALSLSALMQQMESSGSSYLLTTQALSPYKSHNLAWTSYLESTDGFEVVYSSYLPGASTTERSYGLVLLKRTGRNPLATPAQPTLASADTVANLISCERTDRRKHYKKRIKSNFPNGIEVIGDQRDAEEGRRMLDEIYGTTAREGS